MFEERLYDAGASVFKIMGVEKSRVLHNYIKDRMMELNSKETPQIMKVNDKVIDFLVSQLKGKPSEDNAYTCKDSNDNSYILVYSPYMKEFTMKNTNGEVVILIKDELVDIFIGFKEPYQKITMDLIHNTKYKFDTYNGDIVNVVAMEDGVIEFFVTNTNGDTIQEMKRLILSEVDLENIYLSVFVNKEPEVSCKYFGEEDLSILLIRTEGDNYNMIIEDANDSYISTEDMDIIKKYIVNPKDKRDAMEEEEFINSIKE